MPKNKRTHEEAAAKFLEDLQNEDFELQYHEGDETPNTDYIPNTNEIQMFFHCAKCMEEMPDGTSPREWARLEIGFTKLGVQAWCVRHEVNVMHVDFEGQTHPANLTRKEDADA